MTNKQIYNRVYNRLEKIKWAVYAKYGVILRHEKQALYEGDLKLIYFEDNPIVTFNEVVLTLRNKSPYDISRALG